MTASTPATPEPHRLRRAGLGALGVALTLAVALGLCEFLEWPFLRHPLEAKLSQVLDRPVAFGDHFGVRLFGSVRAHADAMTIAPAADGGPALVDESGKPRDFMRAGRVRLALSYRTLLDQWRGAGVPLRVRLLDVDGLELNLKRDADGRANWQFGASPPAASASSPQLPSFERLNVRNGEIRIVDVPLQIDADAHVSTREGSAQPAPVNASAAAVVAGASSPAQAASGAGTDDDSPGLRIDGKGTYRKAQLLLAVRSSGILPIAASEADTPAVPMWLDVRANHSRIRLDGSATDLLHFGGMDATFVASGPSLAAVGDALGVTLPTTADFRTNGRLRKRGTVWNAQVQSMAIGSSRLRGDFSFDTAAAVPKLTGSLSGNRLALVDLGPAFGTAAPDAPAAAALPRKSGRVLPEREFDLPSLKAMNADVGIDLAVLDLGTDKLEPFTPLRGKITLEDGVLNLRDLLARTSAGQVQGEIGLDSRTASPQWSADLRWSGIELARFLKMRNARAKKDANGVRPDTGYISGSLSGDAQLKGAGKSTAALLASLQGTTRFWVRDGQVSHLLVEAAGIDIADALGLYIKGDDKIPAQCAVAKLTLANGKVVPEVAIVDTHESTLLIGGNLSLADETLGLTLTAHPHNFSPLGPRRFSPVAPRTPVDVDGTFSDPHVHLDAKPLLLRGGAAVALGLINPLAALLALIDLRQPERDVCTEAAAQLSQADRPGAKAPAAPSPADRPASGGKSSR
ncbi:MAG: AsmA family protein [Burkholderiaceae bacterium]